ncbi:hypothetical protein [Serratia sp. FGI94]|uniref:hypothetical protein n=1 Tax=Serratia sp. FGI94 TaxID=671990 RepID=UPI000F503088|nr:hypothetical protein [Serratia sp. FGI94]
MKRINVIIIGFISLALVGCAINSGYIEKNYQATMVAPSLGYVDIQSEDLFSDENSAIYVTITYHSNSERFKQRKIYVKNVRPGAGGIRLYAPVINGMTFESMDISLDYGTIRVLRGGNYPESAMAKRLERGVSKELMDKGTKISIKSQMMDSGSYYGLMLRSIKR